MPEGGSVRSEGGHLEISGANAVTILFSNATSFRNYRDIGGDALGTAQGYLRRAEQRSYDQLRQRHIDDFQRLFSRVAVRLGEDSPPRQRTGAYRTLPENDDPGPARALF